MLIFPVGLKKESLSSKGLKKARACKGPKKESVSKAANVPTKEISPVLKNGKSRLSQPKRSLQSCDDDDDDEGVRFSHALCSNAFFSSCSLWNGGRGIAIAHFFRTF